MADAPAKLTSDQFAQTIKAKYPAYQSVDNKTLTEKMLAKYPQYASKVDMGGGAPAATTATPQATAGGGIPQGKPIDWSTSTLPGATTGQAIGTWWAKNMPTQLGGKGGTKASNFVSGGPTGEQVAGDVTKSAAIVGSLAAAPVTIGGAALAGAATGFGMGAGQAAMENASAPDLLKRGTIEGLIGGVVSGGVSLIAKGLSYLPSRIVQNALPKLDPSNTDKVLNETKVGSIKTLLSQSKSALSDFGSQIRDILGGEKYATNVGRGAQSIQDTVNSFPKAEYTPEDVVAAAREVAPGYGKIITAIQNGTATLAQKDELRSAIDIATAKVYGDAPKVSNVKTLAAGFASVLRQEVQSTAKETAPIFAEFTREMDLKGALDAAAEKLDKGHLINLKSIFTYMLAGLPAAIGENLAGSPGAAITEAKAIQAVAPGLQRVAPMVGGLTAGLTPGGSSNSN